MSEEKTASASESALAPTASPLEPSATGDRVTGATATTPERDRACLTDSVAARAAGFNSSGCADSA